MTSVQQYFSKKAAYYDDVDLQPYWVFSDELLWHLLTRLALPTDIQIPFRLLDAGAGTARWSSKVLAHYENATADLIDLSADMLGVAKSKLISMGYMHRVSIQQGDVRKIGQISPGSMDIVFCLHNVIGFFEDTLVALQEFYTLLKPGGICAVMFPSFYHAVYFSNATGRSAELLRIQNDRHVRYNDDMPPLKIFEISEIHSLQGNANFSSVQCYGFPITIYPGMAETFLHGSTERLTSLFEEPHRSRLREIEKALCVQTSLAARGNNILAIFTKSPSM